MKQNGTSVSHRVKIWIIVNSIFLSALYLSVWWPQVWLTSMLIVFIWYAVAANVVAFIRRRTKSYRQPVPSVLGYLVDILALYPMVRNAWYVTASAYVAGAIVQFLVYRNGDVRCNPPTEAPPVGNRNRYEKMVFAFSDLVAAHSPLIGDCSLLPYPKATLLYAIRWVMDEYETNREAAGNEELRQVYDKMLPTLSYLFTRLARDWQEIDPADKDAITKLRDYESFPEWALQYKQKYIDDERASNEAAEVAFQVMKDRIAQEKSGA